MIGIPYWFIALLSLPAPLIALRTWPDGDHAVLKPFHTLFAVRAFDMICWSRWSS